MPEFVTGRRTAWLVLLLAALFSGLVIAFGGTAENSNEPTAALPSSAESAKVAELQKQLPSGETNPALILYARDGAPLTDADIAAIQADAKEFTPLALGGRISPPIYSPDRTAALLAVPFAADLDNELVIDRVTELREKAKDGLPEGLTAQVTGGAGFLADIASSFSGANFKLLTVTAGVVALLLLITYRSPVLWLVPLAVVGLADVVAASIIALMSRATGLNIDPSTTGIVDVLVFGAGTDYALLLIARYREELRLTEDRRAAMRQALRSGGGAIVASAVTVTLSLLTLALAILENDRAIGLAGAIGIVVAAVFGLVVLPAALVVCGRGLFWPFVPKVGDPDKSRTGAWARVAAGVSRRPVAVIVFSLVLLGAMSAGLTDARLGLSQSEQFRVKAESVDGLEALARYYPAGATDPVAVMTTPDKIAEVTALAEDTPGVASVRPGETAGDLAELDVVLKAAPATSESYDAIRALRDRLDSTGALVGGSVATELDTREAAIRDLKVIVPLVLGVVLIVLIVLLHGAIVAPLLLMLTVVATFFASLGASTFLFTHVLGYPALDTVVPLLAFLFLVALGVDYNIFLVTRAREEALRHGTREGIKTAVAVTGGVITSAGILLAAVFAVLGVLPLITLTEIGVIVGLGVLLDTLLVRTVLVPALVVLLDRHFWWPSPLSRVPSPSAEAREKTNA
ncbi:MMPL family transporter [Cryptosporangium aurantiacum]|uniref:Putative drug exporter of the RND superfamily n=1 Tax=Cryptosporangium aurantiacum TaxID=134849 RepID=A0A1M7NDQ7_9ACTN|nr:MMPL family transporter [Cryptosporangium aurantiacum]SHN01792.1 putative drug exporter of the RND superfamily [Cryptosporangium aurantiacum]